jgi:hypothetical protein
MPPDIPFNIHEDDIREQVQEEMYDRHRQFGLRLLAYIYLAEPEEIEIDSSYTIDRGEQVITQTKEEAVKRIKYLLKTQGRTGVLYSLIGNLKAIYPDDEEHKILLFVEMSECQHLLETNEPFAALVRGATFLEKTLSERLSSSSGLAYLIQEAADADVISNEQEMLAQFVRECRNDAGHNFWLDTEYSYVIHEHAVHSQITLLDSLLQRWYQTRWNPVTPRLNSERCLRIVRDEFGFEWGSSDGLRQWDTDSMTERYDRS